jgi:rubrerythrin
MMAYRHWTIDDLPWSELDRAKTDPDLIKVIKAAALVEYNAADYAVYLCNVFPDDGPFQRAAREWAAEETQHGKALGLWAERIDPSFDLEAAFRRFTEGYRIPLDARESVRGSRSGELIARCMVETGTSSYYTAIGDATGEPVLKAICRHIAADELRHYKLFYSHLKRYLEKEDLGRFARLRIALGRIQESEDDELAYAYYAANAGTEPYDRRTCMRAYLRRAFGFYRPRHVDRAIAMIFKACGLKPNTPLHTIATRVAWWLMDNRVRRLAKAAA